MKFYTERLLFLTVSWLLIQKMYGDKAMLGFPPTLQVARPETIGFYQPGTPTPAPAKRGTEEGSQGKRLREERLTDPPAKRPKTGEVGEGMAGKTPVRHLECSEKIQELEREKGESVLERYSKTLARLMARKNVRVEDFYVPDLPPAPANTPPRPN